MSIKILAVDDSRTILESIRIILRGAGFDVEVASSGEEALSLLRTKDYDVVFTDYNMPEMDGIALIRRIRRMVGSKSEVPIVMCTTESENTKKIRGKIVGVNDWVVKPFTLDQLVTAIKKVA